MDKEKLIELFETSNTIADICRALYGAKKWKYYRRIKKIMAEIGYDWDKHLSEINENKRRYCLNCGKEILGEKISHRKFCSSSCSASYNNKDKKLKEETKQKISQSLRKNNVKNEEIKYCKYCGKKLDRGHTIFCSNDCRNSYLEEEYLKYIERWKNGDEPGHVPCLKIHQYVRRYLFEKNNNSCEMCGWSHEHPITHKIPLQIHHIDGDCTNNSEDNLQLLCPNCHSLTENFGSRNKNSKRVFRRQKIYHLDYQ